MLERKVSGKAAEIASQPSEPKVFDTPEQVIEQGTNMIMNTVDKAANEFIDQALVAIQSPNLSLCKASMQAIIRFSELSLMHKRVAHSAVSSIGLDFV